MLFILFYEFNVQPSRSDIHFKFPEVKKLENTFEFSHLSSLILCRSSHHFLERNLYWRKMFCTNKDLSVASGLRRLRWHIELCTVLLSDKLSYVVQVKIGWGCSKKGACRGNPNLVLPIQTLLQNFYKPFSARMSPMKG